MTAVGMSGTNISPTPVVPLKADLHDLLRTVEAHQAALLRLCAALEDIADSLPYGLDRDRCLAVAGELSAAVASAARFEEAALWPWARDYLGAGPHFPGTIERLRDEHRADEDFAREAADVLTDWGRGTGRHDPETTGYMLRGLFIGLRRHVAFENAFLVRPLQARCRGPEGAGSPA